MSIDPSIYNYKLNPNWINEDNTLICADCGTTLSVKYIREDGETFCNKCIINNLDKEDDIEDLLAFEDACNKYFDSEGNMIHK